MKQCSNYYQYVFDKILGELGNKPNFHLHSFKAICAWALVTIVESAKDKSKKKLSSKETEAYKAEIAELKERVSVLEKIVTDERYDLKKQFADLESDRVA